MIFYYCRILSPRKNVALKFAHVIFHMNRLSIPVLFSNYGYSRVKLDFWTGVTRNAGGWDHLVSDAGMHIEETFLETCYKIFKT